MKIVKVFLILVVLCIPLVAFSSTIKVYDAFNSSSLTGWNVVSGNWRVINGRLTQTDVNEKMAMITIPVDQSGIMMYEFDLRYLDGGQDNYAGFGIHICVGNPSTRRSWGNGRSLLGWVTWDPDQYGRPGAFIQVYQSTGPTSMGLYTRIFPSPDPLKDGDLLPIRSEYLKTEYLSYTVPIRLQVDTRTGRGKFFDPANPKKYFYSFDLGGPIRPGSYFSFRTNSVSVSIDNVKISKLD
jgi:hypothetical protein